MGRPDTSSAHVVTETDSSRRARTLAEHERFTLSDAQELASIYFVLGCDAAGIHIERGERRRGCAA